MGKSKGGLPLSRLGCFTLAEEKEKAWFLGLKTNTLYEHNKLNNSAKILKTFSDRSAEGNPLYLTIEKVGNILVLGSGRSTNVAFYDLADDTCEYMELIPVENDRKVQYTENCNFIKSCTHENSVYLFGYEYPAILKIDMATRRAAYLNDWVTEIERRISKLSVSMGYISDYVVVGSFAWALCECVNAIIRLDLRTDEMEIIDICSDLDIQCGICFDGNFWVTGNNEYENKLLKYNHQFFLEKDIEICSAKNRNEDYYLPLKERYWPIYPVVDMGEKLLLFSVYPNHVYEFEKEAEQVSIHPVFEKLIEIRDERLYGLKILVPRRKKDIIYFVTGNDFMWNEYDIAHDKLSRYEVMSEGDEEILREYSKILVGRIIGEDDLIWNLGYKLTLSRFLEHIKYVSLNEVGDRGENDNVGVKIYKGC